MRGPILEYRVGPLSRPPRWIGNAENAGGVETGHFLRKASPVLLYVLLVVSLLVVAFAIWRHKADRA